ncbi:MAG: hypothetical protein ACKVQR_04460 [Aquabacterium sp.]
MPIRTMTLTGTILNAASLSDEIVLNGLMVEAIIMPAIWSAAGLSFEAAEASGGTFLPLFDVAGVEITATVDINRRVVMPISLIRGHNVLKLRSGTSAVPANQGGNRSITLLCRDFS